MMRIVRREQFHLVVDELLKRDAGEAGVGEYYVGGWFVLIVLVLGDVVGGEIDAEAIHHHALRHTKRLSNFQKLFG